MKKLLYIEFSDTEPIAAWIEEEGNDMERYIASAKKADKLMAAGKLADTGIWSGETWASLLFNPDTRKFGRSFNGAGHYEVYELDN
jgi:hypothetical protein